ncbi:flavin reductase family protein [uncultured Cohaesibacter sp.]|uniref:flavin reductase family protein n=1 Tax=uncultured Cohaesibacter sp. TaxID=1002546 RepID=UPI00292FDEFD|nr:flavin reductase family protein [uncultured Cohaesibacter sp.]
MIDAADYRRALGQFATGIAVVTTMDGSDQPCGLTVDSFNSVSLDPPLVLWSLDKRSGQLDAFCSSGFYGVNILAKEQVDISNLFAGLSDDRFSKVDWEQGETGAPLFKDALVCLDCKTETIIEGGDHLILLGRVVSIGAKEGEPLLYYAGGYRELAPSDA